MMWCNWCNYVTFDSMKRSLLIYQERESKHLEFKSSLPKFISLIKTCIAFANGNGGRIIIGVDDQTRKIIGISDKERNRIYDDFPNSLYDSASPSAPSSLNLRVSSSIFSRLALRSISLTLLCLPRSPRFARQKNLDKSTLRFKLDGALAF